MSPQYGLCRDNLVDSVEISLEEYFQTITWLCVNDYKFCMNLTSIIKWT